MSKIMQRVIIVVVVGLIALIGVGSIFANEEAQACMASGGIYVHAYNGYVCWSK